MEGGGSGFRKSEVEFTFCISVRVHNQGRTALGEFGERWEQASEIPRDGRLVRKFGVRRKGETPCCKAYPERKFYCVFYILSRDVAVVVCTNINYNSQPYIEGDLDLLDRLSCYDAA
jgi:hypothetical protein